MNIIHKICIGLKLKTICMNLDFVIWIILLSPLAFLATAILSWFQPGMRPMLTKRMGISSAFLSIITAAISGFFVIKYGLFESALLGINDFGLSIRLDSVSMIMYSMIAIIAFIVMKFSLNYLDGDRNHGRFIGRLAATIASVQLLVLSGNLGLLLISWILTSISLHRLLVFYRDRPGAISAARKKFIMARLGDLCLLIAVTLLYLQFETGNMESIFEQISLASLPLNVEAAAIALVFAALFKSAQFPTHGWLIEVMETPTPVSALLHAGLLNAGPFLLIRMAFVMDASTYAPMFIIVIGGFTAMFASLAFLTQTSVKTALGYSSVAHMGFSLMVCGLGVYPAAMLHLVAHSFYKAHSFLSSGSIIDSIRASKVKKAKRTGNPFKIATGFVLALGIYAGFAIIWGIDPNKEIALLAIGAIMVMGLSTLFTSALDTNGSFQLVLRASLLALIVALSFFTLESGFHFLLSGQVPELSGLSVTEGWLIAGVLLAFGLVVLFQILAPLFASGQTYTALAIHLRNGLYANAILDRIIGSLRIPAPAHNSIAIEQLEMSKQQEPAAIEKLEKQAV